VAHTAAAKALERVMLMLVKMAVARIQGPCTILLLSGQRSGDVAAPTGRAVSSRVR
jgi:hypothetical protein